MSPRLTFALIIIIFTGTVLTQTNPARSNGYIYAPKNSEFRVKFPGTPKIEAVATQTASGEQATFATASVLLRVEHNVMSEEALGGAAHSTDDEIKESMLAIARNGNYVAPSVIVMRSPLGRKVIMAGYKVIGGTRVRIEHQSYMGETSIMSLIVLAPSSLFQTKLVLNFFSSIETNPSYIRSSNDFLYAPKVSEFTVTFPGKPDFRSVEFDAGVEEESTLITGGSVLRCEFGKLSAQTIRLYQAASDSQLRSIFFSLGNENGYSSISVSVQNTKIGREVELRGNKTIDGVPMLYEHHMYFGDYSAITLVVSSPAHRFPTPPISKFLNSIKRM